MEFKKMALVEPRLLDSLQKQQQHHENTCHHQPQAMLDNKLCDLDQSMQDILGQKNLSQEQKLKLYQQHLQKYLLFKDKVEPPTVKIVGEDKVEEILLNPTSTSSSSSLPSPTKSSVIEGKETVEMEILQSAPKNLRRKASLLL